MAEPQYFNNLSLDQLKALRKGKDSPQARIGGLTRMQPHITGKGVINFALLPDRTVCAQFAQYDFNIEIPEVTVYVAREFSASSCSYDAVLEHEMKHVDAAKAFLPRYAEKASKQLKEYFRQLGVVYAHSEEEARKIIAINDENLNNYLKNLGNEFLTNTVDTPEEKKRIANSCNGETKRIFEQAGEELE